MYACMHVCMYACMYVCMYVVGAVLKPLSVNLYKPQIDYIKVCKTLARERCAKAARKRREKELPN